MTIAMQARRIQRPFYYSPDAELAEYRRQLRELGGRPAKRDVAGLWQRPQIRQGYEFPDGSFMASDF